MTSGDWVIRYWFAIGTFALIGVGLLLLNQWWGLALLGLAGASLYGARSVKNKPKHILLYTVADRRTDKLGGPGLTLLAPPLIDGIEIRAGRKNNDFVFTDVRSRLEKDGEPHSGGATKVEGSVTWEIDETDAGCVRDYIDAGIPDETGKQPSGGVVEIMLSMLREVSRQWAGGLDWETFMFGKQRLSAALLSRLTGEKPFKLKRNGEAELILIATAEGEAAQVEREYKLAELTGTDDTTDLHTLLDLEFYFKQALENGFTDIHDLGIKVRRLNVENISPEGELKKDAEAPAREKQQARKQKIEQENRLQAAETIVEAAIRLEQHISLETAFAILRVEEGKAEEKIFRLATEGNLEPLARALSPFLAAAADITRSLDRKPKKGGRR